MHVYNKKNILILGKGSTQRLNDTTLTSEAEYPLTLMSSNRNLSLILNYNGVNSCLFVNGVEICIFKDSEINVVPLCLGIVPKDFSADDIKNTGLYQYVCDFPVYYDSIDVDDFWDIHECLTVKNDMK